MRMIKTVTTTVQIIVPQTATIKRLLCELVGRTPNGANKGKFQIIPLGGLGEIGKNMTIFQYEDEIIVLDCWSCVP